MINYSARVRCHSVVLVTIGMALSIGLVACGGGGGSFPAMTGTSAPGPENPMPTPPTQEPAPPTPEQTSVPGLTGMPPEQTSVPRLATTLPEQASVPEPAPALPESASVPAPH